MNGRRTGRRAGIRYRAAFASTVIVAGFVLVASVAFVLAQRTLLERSFTDAATQQALDTAARVRTEGAAADLTAGTGDQSLIQIVDTHGTVLSSSAVLANLPAITDARPAVGTTTTVRSGIAGLGEEGGEFVIAARTVEAPGGPVVVLVAENLELVGQATWIAIGLLALGVPLVIVGVAFASYWLVGRSLAPVEAIRAQVAQIEGTTELNARVPVPPGGDEIARLAATMNSMLERLSGSMDQQRRFVADASHELRSPLATIRAAHEVGALHPENRDWAATTEDVMAELDRLDVLVANLLLLARADEHAVRFKMTDVDLDDIVLTESRRLRAMGDITVTVEAPPVRITGDRTALARALRNLSDNAARHATNHVAITLSADSRNAWLVVEDDGPGIPADQHDRVFERFVRLDESRARDSGGAGLGLSIAREICHLHGGTLTIEDGDLGARLVMTLPLEHRQHPPDADDAQQ